MLLQYPSIVFLPTLVKIQLTESTADHQSKRWLKKQFVSQNSTL